jgi:hypothetical protein
MKENLNKAVIVTFLIDLIAFLCCLVKTVNFGSSGSSSVRNARLERKMVIK